MMKDVLLAVRADEATHRQYVERFFSSIFCIRQVLCFRVNHKLADVGPNAPNPFLTRSKEERNPPNEKEQNEIDTAGKK
jgi:hypothetical protein